ncbi:hypothetical protein V7266_26730 [Neobacillus drentensis]
MSRLPKGNKIAEEYSPDGTYTIRHMFQVVGNNR